MARRKTHTDKWWDAAPPHVLRCTGLNKTDGAQCRAEASPGTTVCDRHGALAPAVQAAAANRVQMSVDQAAQFLIDAMNDAGTDMRERVKVAQDLLDRGGLGATSKLLVGVGPVDPVETMFRNILSSPDGLLEPEAPPEAVVVLDERGAVLDVVAIEDSPYDDVVDAEVVEDQPLVRPIATTDAPRRPTTRPPRHIRDGFALTDLL